MTPGSPLPTEAIAPEMADFVWVLGYVPRYAPVVRPSGTDVDHARTVHSASTERGGVKGRGRCLEAP
jgi:hypothetical protein